MKLLAFVVAAPDADDDERPRDRRIDDALAQDAEPQKPRSAHPGTNVDKYFGTKLPPVCAKLGCYLTDDGKRYYCVNSSCQKHKKRATKHTRVRTGRPDRRPFVYFRCPRCRGRDVEMHLITNEYACGACKYIWKR